MTNEKRSGNKLKMSTVFKYLLLIVAGLGILLFCSLFQHVTTSSEEYHYSELLRGNYLTIPGMTIFFIVGFCIGYFWKLNPWLAAFCLFFIFPLTSLIEATIYQGSHNLIPFEFIIFFCYSLPSVIAVYLGRYVSNQVAKRKHRSLPVK